MGKKAVFLRLNECNLDCSFCDTPYTWDRSNPAYAERQRWSVSKAHSEILAAARDSCSRLVLTGGEPLLQQANLAELCAMEPLSDWDVEIETNGTIVPHAFEGREKLQINCSPKLSNSSIDRERRIRPPVLQTLAMRFNTYFKFVVRDIDDLEEIQREYVPLLDGLAPGRIYISPEGLTVDQIDGIRERVVDAVRQMGFVMGDRRHVRLYGNKRQT